MATPESTDKLEKEFNLSLNSIVDTAERSAQLLRQREKRSRIARSLILGFLECVVVIGVIFALFFAGLHTSYDMLILAAAGIGSWVSGAGITYLVLGRRKNPHLDELSGLIQQIKSKQEDKTTENALTLADRMLAILPEVVRRRTEDSIFFGVIAFILSWAITRFAPAALVVGVVVWLYFRYEINKSYENVISKLQQQKQAFEQRKKEFIESL